MRIVFMGTPDFAVPTLAALHDAAHEIVAVYTQPPRPAGRGKKLQPSAVQREAEIRHLDVFSPVSLKSSNEQEKFAALGADLAVVAAYGLILPQAILDAPKRGCLNVHASLLPRWRGAAPVQRAILAGDPLTGVTLMQMEAGLDTGPMLATARVQVADKTAGELTAELAEVGAQLMVGTLTELEMLHAVAQPEDGVTYAKKIDKAESRIDWSLPARADRAPGSRICAQPRGLVRVRGRAVSHTECRGGRRRWRAGRGSRRSTYHCRRRACAPPPHRPTRRQASDGHRGAAARQADPGGDAARLTRP